MIGQAYSYRYYYYYGQLLLAREEGWAESCRRVMLI
jgi:hypothetical protein